MAVTCSDIITSRNASSTVMSGENLFLAVINSGNMFLAVISGRMLNGGCSGMYL